MDSHKVLFKSMFLLIFFITLIYLNARCLVQCNKPKINRFFSKMRATENCFSSHDINSPIAFSLLLLLYILHLSHATFYIIFFKPKPPLYLFTIIDPKSTMRVFKLHFYVSFGHFFTSPMLSLHKNAIFGLIFL